MVKARFKVSFNYATTNPSTDKQEETIFKLSVVYDENKKHSSEEIRQELNEVSIN